MSLLNSSSKFKTCLLFNNTKSDIIKIVQTGVLLKAESYPLNLKLDNTSAGRFGLLFVM